MSDRSNGWIKRCKFGINNYIDPQLLSNFTNFFKIFQSILEIFTFVAIKKIFIAFLQNLDLYSSKTR